MSRSEKAQRSLENMLVSGMTALTKHGARLEAAQNNNISSPSRMEDNTEMKDSQGTQGGSPPKGKRQFSFGKLGIGQNAKRNETSSNTTNKFAGSLKKFQRKPP